MELKIEVIWGADGFSIERLTWGGHSNCWIREDEGLVIVVAVEVMIWKSQAEVFILNLV